MFHIAFGGYLTLSFLLASELLFVPPMVAGDITIIVIEDPAWSVGITVPDAFTFAIIFCCSFDLKGRSCCTPKEMI